MNTITPDAKSRSEGELASAYTEMKAVYITH
jgi:hypothetical protein